MRMSRVLLAVIALLPAVVLADDPPAAKPPANGWSGKGQFGFLASQGNAQAQSANAALDMAYVSGAWKQTLNAAMLYGESADVVSAERWDALFQSNYQFSSKFYAFGAARYEHDLFDGFQYQGSGTLGVGYKAIETSSVKLSVQLGAGYTLSREETLTTPYPPSPATPIPGFVARMPGARDNYAISTTGIDYEQKLTSTTTLSDKLLVNAGSANTLVTNTLALAVKVSTKLALSLGYNLQDNTNPAPTTKHVDTTETVNLVYAFGS